jgi:hypothetical protein
MGKSGRLPTRFPDATKYVLEAQGGLVRRYVEFPDGRRVSLETRKARTCCAAALQNVSIVPGLRAGRHAESHRKSTVSARLA